MYCGNSNENNVLDVLRKYDPFCQSVIDSCSRVKLYNYDRTINQWKQQNNSEGPFYLIIRSSMPFYKIIVLCNDNKTNSSNHIHITISEQIQTQIHNNFIMFKTEKGCIDSIGFATKSDCQRISNKLDNIIAELRRPPDSEDFNLLKQIKIESHNHNKTNDQDRIISMFENAKTRSSNQNAIGGAGNSEFISKPRPIDINELFAPKSNNQQTELYSSDMPMRSRAISTPIVTNFKLVQTQTESNGLLTDTSTKVSSTLTVTELERKLVEDASLSKPSFYEDDDETLLQPDHFESDIRDDKDNIHNDILKELSAPQKQNYQFPLSKEALRDSLISLLQTDKDGSFISLIHSAYLETLRKQQNRK